MNGCREGVNEAGQAIDAVGKRVSDLRSVLAIGVRRQMQDPTWHHTETLERH